MIRSDGIELAYEPAPIAHIIAGGPGLHPVEQAVSALFSELRESDRTNHPPEVVRRNDQLMLLRLGIGSCASICAGVEYPQAHPTEETVHTLAVVGSFFGITAERVRQIGARQRARGSHDSRGHLHEAIAAALTAVEPDRKIAATRYGAGRLLVHMRHWDPV